MQHAIDSSLKTRKALSRGAGLSLFVIAIWIGGCHSLPQGNPQTLAKPAPPRVILLRGWQDLYSEGIDQLGNEIAAHGIATEVFRANQWQDVADTLSRSSGTRPLILVGFSYGADDVILIARQLRDAHCPVDLLITIDPVTPQPVPDNVRRCFNYYESNGVWDAFPWLRGVPLKSEAANVHNLNLRTDRKDLLQEDTSHATIAGNPLLHREIVRRVVEGLNR